MKSVQNKFHYHNALTTAAEMIRGQFETGAMAEEAGFDSEEDMELYVKQCANVAKMLAAKAAKYYTTHKLYNYDK